MKLTPPFRLSSVFFGILLLVTIPAATQAYTLISNLDAPTFGTAGTHYVINTDSVGSVTTSYQSIAQNFITGPVPVTIQSLTIRMGYGGQGSYGFKLILQGGDATTSTIFGLPLPPITPNGDHPELPGLYTYATPNVTLQANTGYTLTASTEGFGTDHNDYEWGVTSPGLEDNSTPFGPSDFILEPYFWLKESVLGVTDTDPIYYDGSWGPNYYAALQFSINAVPEPSKALLLMTGLTLTALRRRRKNV